MALGLRLDQLSDGSGAGECRILPLSLSFSLCVIYSDMAVTFQYSACFTYEDRGLKAKDRGDIFYNKQNEYVFRTLKWSLRSWLKSPRMIHMKGIMNNKHIR